MVSIQAVKFGVGWEYFSGGTGLSILLPKALIGKLLSEKISLAGIACEAVITVALVSLGLAAGF